MTNEPICTNGEHMPAGRPTKYTPAMGEKARKLALLGMTDVEVADMLGINPDTLYEWDKKYPEFAETRARGKADADAEMAASLWQRGIGYTHDDVHVTAFNGEVTLTPVQKHYPPDFQSISLWLRNRRPDLWKEKVDIALSGGLTTTAIPYDPAKLEPEQREVLRDALLTMSTSQETEDE